MIEWEAPPDERRSYKRNRYLEELRMLIEHPQTWARIDTFDAPNKANSARNNLKYAVDLKRYRVPEGAENFVFTLKVRRLPDGQSWGLYAMAEEKEGGEE